MEVSIRICEKLMFLMEQTKINYGLTDSKTEEWFFLAFGSATVPKAFEKMFDDFESVDKNFPEVEEA